MEGRNTGELGGNTEADMAATYYATEAKRNAENARRAEMDPKALKELQEQERKKMEKEANQKVDDFQGEITRYQEGENAKKKKGKLAKSK